MPPIQGKSITFGLLNRRHAWDSQWGYTLTFSRTGMWRWLPLHKGGLV